MKHAIVPKKNACRDGWYKSSFSNASGSCVEVKHGRGVVLVRDSKNQRPDQPVLGVTAAGWNSFLSTLAG